MYCSALSADSFFLSGLGRWCTGAGLVRRHFQRSWYATAGAKSRIRDTQNASRAYNTPAVVICWGSRMCRPAESMQRSCPDPLGRLAPCPAPHADWPPLSHSDASQPWKPGLLFSAMGGLWCRHFGPRHRGTAEVRLEWPRRGVRVS